MLTHACHSTVETEAGGKLKPKIFRQAWKTVIFPYVIKYYIIYTNIYLWSKYMV